MLKDVQAFWILNRICQIQENMLKMNYTWYQWSMKFSAQGWTVLTTLLENKRTCFLPPGTVTAIRFANAASTDWYLFVQSQQVN